MDERYPMGRFYDSHTSSACASRARHIEHLGVGALIQRGGRAVAGMLTIATAGGS